MEDLDLQVAYVRRWRLLKSEISPCAALSRDDKEWDRDDEGYSIIFEYCLVVREIIAIFAAE